jgi:hypothetical protein
MGGDNIRSDLAHYDVAGDISYGSDCAVYRVPALIFTFLASFSLGGYLCNSIFIDPDFDVYRIPVLHIVRSHRRRSNWSSRF